MTDDFAANSSYLPKPHAIPEAEVPELKWARLLNSRRFSDDLRQKQPAPANAAPWLVEGRTEIERDYDRILFSTPVRRLGDKTQVFPLEKNDSVRTRLTHSHEVSNLARSIGVSIAYGSIGSRIAEDLKSSNDAEIRVKRDIPAMLAAVGLAHDLGNPPFGHQGENAIRRWFKKNADTVFSETNTTTGERYRPLSPDQQLDFEKFEGNAQTLRVLTRLQVVQDDLGLNLTYGTLAALMKYTVGAARIDAAGRGSRKKIGHFASERHISEEVWRQTGLAEGIRHPLTFVMEACDDIAYLVLDAEDAVKKQIVSFSDLVAWLDAHKNADDKVAAYVIDAARRDHQKHRESVGLSPAELNDVSMQKFRVHAIHAMVSVVLRGLEQRYEDIMNGRFDGSLIGDGAAADFAAILRRFDSEHAYAHQRVREVELTGFNTINGLLDYFWRAIAERNSGGGKDSVSPFAQYTYSRISENYRRIFEQKVPSVRTNEPQVPVRYRELQLLTDMVSGMTDGFAVDMHNELSKFDVGASRGQ